VLELVRHFSRVGDPLNHSIVARHSYRWGLPAVTLAVLAPTLARMPLPAGSSSYVLATLIWGSLVAVAELAPLSLPWPEVTVRLTPAFEFGALLCFGTVPTALLVGLGRFSASLLRRDGPIEAIFEAARSMLVIAIAGAVYFDQGGAVGPAIVSGSISFTATALAMAAFALSGAALEAWKAAAETPYGHAPARIGAFPQQLIVNALAMPIGMAFAWLELTSGPVAGACALVILMMSRSIERAPAEKKSAHAGDVGDSRLDTVRLLMSAIDAFDPFTRGLSNRIANTAVRTARQLGIPEAEIDEIEYAALLHDIGRTAIQLDFVTKPGSLEAHERAVLNTHPTVGYDLIRTLTGLEGAAEIVYAHHEQPDGRGYPRGLEGDEIPVGSRIIMVAAAYDAMTRERPYRKGLTPSAACDELRRHAGTQFFPEVVDAFISLLRSGELQQESNGPENSNIPTPLDETPSDRMAA
jgi:HD-GYP domain-containing protein (c-di-GMP phosphodiesterase class II)